MWVAGAVAARSAAFACAKMAATVSVGRGLAAMALNTWYALELTSLVVQAFCWTLALRRLPLYLAYPFMSLVFGVNLLLAWALFGEAVGWRHLAGMAVIMAGVATSASSAKQGAQ